MDETQCPACEGAGGFAPFDGDGSGGHECATCLGTGRVSVPGTFDAMQEQRAAIEGRLAVAQWVDQYRGRATPIDVTTFDGIHTVTAQFSDTVRIGQHTYRRVDADGRFVLPPQCDTLAGLVAHVAGNPEDVAGVSALADRLIESESRYTEIPAAVGELVRGLVRAERERCAGVAERWAEWFDEPDPVHERNDIVPASFCRELADELRGSE